MTVAVVTPVRCPDCRSRLTSKNMPYFSRRFWMRWCPKCRHTVAYVDDHDRWFIAGAVCEGENPWTVVTA